MNINMSGRCSFSFGGGLLNGTPGLKSTQQRMERQEERDRQVAFFENQKENLKGIKCDTVEDIARKLELFHSYEDQIRAAKAAYNNEQIWHMMDESREIGEKIAEAVEKSKPKTAEERKEDLVEELTGAESGGIMEELDEVMEEAQELQEELRTEEIAQKDLQQTMDTGNASGNLQQTVEAENASEDLEPGNAPEDLQRITEDIAAEEAGMTPQELLDSKLLYRPVDIRV